MLFETPLVLGRVVTNYGILARMIHLREWWVHYFCLFPSLKILFLNLGILITAFSFSYDCGVTVWSLALLCQSVCAKIWLGEFLNGLLLLVDSNLSCYAFQVEWVSGHSLGPWLIHSLLRFRKYSLFRGIFVRVVPFCLFNQTGSVELVIILDLIEISVENFPVFLSSGHTVTFEHFVIIIQRRFYI